MTITERIEYDVKCLNGYFRKLFTMANEASLQEFLPVATSEESEGFVAHNVIAFIRPDMVCNVYSLVDFWLPQLCSFHKRKSSLVLSYKDIKGASDLDAYHKYLTKVATLSLQNAQPSYDHLDNLRMVRNCDIHNGGHIKDEQQRIKLAQVPGITVSGSLVIIADSFVWDSLNHAKVYLCAIAQA
ncbi:MAG: hypothetical protein PHP70_09870 [Gallionella sp.]|nr:hypothetical protein [Gallionella sp.]